jgi:spermidine synthase
VKGYSIKPVHILVLGVCALLAQAMFLREVISFFTGTEMVVGILIAAWLFWVGAGGIYGGRIVAPAARRDRTVFMWLAVAVACLLPSTTVAIRIGRSMLVRPPGELPPLAPALVFSVLVIAPFGLIYGTLYNVASRLVADPVKGLPGGISRVYIWEASGTLTGAVLFSVVLLPLISQLQAAFAVAFIVIAVVLLSVPRTKRFVWRLAVTVLMGIAIVLSAARIDRWSIGAVYPGYTIERYLSSRYGEVVALSTEGLLSFFSGGGRLFSVPEPEVAEEIVHIPMLLHPRPQRVLLIGGSLGGGWEEAVKHPSLEHLDCLELDGRLLSLAIDLVPEGAAGDGPGARAGRKCDVRFVVADGRFHLTGGPEPYDVIIVRTPPPVNMQWNRYYTREFFDLARRSLRPGGVLAFTHPSSENFLSPSLVRLLRSIKLTLEGVFEEVILLPGPTTHFIAGGEPLSGDVFLARLEARGIETRYINEDFLPFRFSPERIDFLRSSVEGADEVDINTDARPMLTFYELLLEGQRTGSSIIGVFGALIGLPPFLPAVILFGVIFVIGLVVRGGAAARLSIWAVGFGSFLFQLVVLLAYQSYSGHLYHAIVILTALFMAGAAFGAFLSHRASDRLRHRHLRMIHLSFIGLTLLLIGWFHALSTLGPPLIPGSIVFMVFSVLCGFLTGAYYPVVVRMALPQERRAVPAVFYAWDLFGACAAGFIGGIVLFPITGITGTALLVSGIHALAGVLLVGRW